MNTVIIILLSIILLVGIALLVSVRSVKRGSGVTKEETEDIVKAESDHQMRSVQGAMNASNVTLLNAITMHTDTQGKSMDRFLSVVAANLERQEKAQQEFIKNFEAKLDSMKRGIESSLTEVRKENTEQLDKMRLVVEEKMQDLKAVLVTVVQEHLQLQLVNRIRKFMMI